jgi:hypothetical protein
MVWWQRDASQHLGRRNLAGGQASMGAIADRAVIAGPETSGVERREMARPFTIALGQMAAEETKQATIEKAVGFAGRVGARRSR